MNLQDTTFKEQTMPATNDGYTWVLVKSVPGGHKFYRNEANGRMAIADRSGRYPNQTDDGVLYVDKNRPISISHDGYVCLPILNEAEQEYHTVIDIDQAVWLAREHHHRVVVTGKQGQSYPIVFQHEMLSEQQQAILGYVLSDLIENGSEYVDDLRASFPLNDNQWQPGELGDDDEEIPVSNMEPGDPLFGLTPPKAKAAPSSVLALLRETQRALACYRDEEEYVHPVHGHLCLEEVKYLLVDRAIEALTGEEQ